MDIKSVLIDVIPLNREYPDFLERYFSGNIHAININQSEKMELVESVLMTANAQLLHAYLGWLPFDANLLRHRISAEEPIKNGEGPTRIFKLRFSSLTITKSSEDPFFQSLLSVQRSVRQAECAEARTAVLFRVGSLARATHKSYAQKYTITRACKQETKDGHALRKHKA